ADLEVVGVVAGGDLEGAGAELGVDLLVGDYLEATADQGQEAVVTNQVAVAVVLGIDRNRRVGKHRLGPNGGDGEDAVRALDRVVDQVQLLAHLAVLDLEIGDRRARPRIPVDDVV